MKIIILPKREIINEYKKGKSTLELGKKYNCSWITILRFLEKNKCPIRTHREKTINAYKKGKMKFMQKVWKQSGKRWKAEGNPRWKPIGAKRMNKGYIYVKITEGKGFQNWTQEHRFVMEQRLGRKLRKYEIVHHINGKKDDNRLSNLRLMTDKQHRRFHTKHNLHK